MGTENFLAEGGWRQAETLNRKTFCIGTWLFLMYLQTGRAVDFLQLPISLTSSTPLMRKTTDKLLSLSYVLRYLNLGNFYRMSFIVVQITDRLTLGAL